MSEKIIKTEDMQFWTENYGDPKNPAIILITGAMNQGIVWPENLCLQLSEKGYFVIRYDHRDTGKSSKVNFHERPYTLDDLACDVIEILDGYRIQKAHIVGASMGGAIGQLMALDHPERIYTLTSIMASPQEAVYMRAVAHENYSEFDLPPPRQEIIDFVNQSFVVKPETEEEKIQLILKGWRLYNGEAFPFEEEEMYELQKKIRERTDNLGAAFNHRLAVAASENRLPRIDQIKVPTLIIHGEKDPVVPVEHGIETAKRIHNAKLEIIPDMGHIIPSTLSEKIGNIILSFVEQFQQQQ